ncbi:MAG: roadblock/LC7 domain-containing protein [Candidatus Thermoplasmatota archaeon]|jgi:predicted regulator of Ras-like GTPase activity (Roadblock/LC7/MglB family)|nr:roadblock/LC7 domain-containing protein [Candidatus Thermoplasmatota archaeon]
MREEIITTLINDFLKKPYVDSAMLVTKVGIPLAGRAPQNTQVEIFATMAGVTYGGAEELIGPPKERLKGIVTDLDGGKRIVLKGLMNLYILVISVKEYDENIKKEIDSFAETLAKGL